MSPPHIDCPAARLAILDEERGRLHETPSQALAAHLRGCADCARDEAAERLLTEQLEGQLPQYAAPLALKQRSNGPWIVAFLAAAGAGVGGYWLHQGRQNARQDAAAATQRAQAAEEAKTELTAKVEKLESEKTELATAKDELSKDVQAKTGELEQLKGTYNQLEEKMKDEISKGDIRLSQSGGKLRVDMVDKILFDSGEAVISKRGEGVLARVGAVLATMDDKQIQVSGHTDSNPLSEKLATQFPPNWELSVARAVNL